MSDTGGHHRRRVLAWLASVGTAAMTSACGGGGSTTSATDAGATTTSTTTTTGTTTTTTTTSAASPWPWATTGTSTTATAQTLADFAQVIASGTVTYAFKTSAASTTTDPVTGVTTDTSSTATLSPYLMSRRQVTNANWMAFCSAKGSSYFPSFWSGGTYPAGKEDHPVLFVSYNQALDYCAWLETQIAGYVFYVPTEGEWEYAALGANTSYAYPWGASSGISYNTSTGVLATAFNCNCLCTQYVLNSSGIVTLTYYDDDVVAQLADGTALTNDTAPLAKVLSMASSGGVSGWQYDSDSNKTWADFANSDTFDVLVHTYGGYTTPVGAYEAGTSWCGLYDMAGNVFEWTSTQNVAGNGIEAGTTVNAVKGGSWYAVAASCRSTNRAEGRSPSGGYHSVGLRIAARTT